MNANLLRWIVWIVMIIGCVVVSTILVNEALRLTASPTVTAIPTVTPTPVPTLTAIPTPTPVPTDTRVPLSLLERYEDLAERGIMTMEELRWGKDRDCTGDICDQTYFVFEGPDGVVVRFDPVGWNGSTGQYSPDSARQDVSIYGPYYSRSVSSYIEAHNYWVHLTRLSRGEAVFWPIIQTRWYN